VPKQIHKIDQFHGGLNTNSDPRDIADNELSVALGVMVDELGAIRMLGGDAEHDAETGAAGAHACAISNGYGLFAWNHDRIDGHTVSADSDDDETGENYLALSDADTTGKVHIYADSDDTWGTPIDTGTDGTRKDVFYAADGALRVCDSEFGNTNTSKWYGYIDRQLFQSIGDTVTTDQWYLSPQEIASPDNTSEFDQAVTTSTLNNQDLYDSGDSDKNQYYEISADTLYDNGSGDDSSTRNMKGFLEVTVRINTENYGAIPAISDFEVTFTLKTGSGRLDTNAFVGVLGTNYKETFKSETGSMTPSAAKDIVYTFDMGDHYYDSGGDGQSFANGDATYGILTQLSTIDFNSTYINSVDIRKVRVQEANPSDNTISVLTTGNLHLQVFYDTPTSGTAMGWDKRWEYGVSFIYDEKQESLVRRMFDSSASDTTEHNNSSGAGKSPTAKLYVKHGSTTDFNRRITGAVWYIREASSSSAANEWTAQVEYDFVKGVSRVLATGIETDCSFDAISGQYEFEVDDDNLLSPNLVDTYTSRTGVLSEETSIKSRFKTAVMVGRRMYIGGIKNKDEDGIQELKGDAMLKSPVNKFDIFPSSSVVEAAINDGESIVALEEFADRILQFKEQTLYIINVSQDIEFLEDVYKYKGVSQPSAVCKTDYGIAWVNKFGCYLYDGKQVINLLEKGGRQIIRDHGSSGRFSWETFSTYNPMIGYLPHKRQLLVVDDNTVSGSGNIMLYDMVTQSWVRGNSSITSNVLTNFVNDWDGNLVWAHTSGSATMRMWDDDSAGQSNFAIYTKDIDFGEPGRNKKLYKVLVTYDTGNATSNVHAKYIADGLSGAVDFVANSGANFTTPPELDSANGWEIAELKPDTSSEANNKKSFKLIFITDGTVPSGFKINDISCIYRMKNIK